MGDPRTRDYPLVMDPLFVVTLMAGYLYFVKVGGPRWMKNREPFRILNIVRLYNLALVLINVRFLYVVLRFTYLPGGHYNLWCQGITGYVTDEMQEYYRTGYVYTISRYMDLLDTVFFVLRKKFTHITHLHVIHHTIVVANVWFFTLFAPEGQPVLGMCLNVFIHIIMYSYYFPGNAGARRAQVPLVEEVPDHYADRPTFLILCLFINFYIKTYIAKPNHPVRQDHNGTMDAVVEPLKNGKSE
ncbi:hypothetical protein MTO96_015083 [Rhipicephalus appendiculatus]